MKTGLAYAADIIGAEAVSDDDRDLAALCEYVSSVHRPGPGMVCLACGELWVPADRYPNVGGIRCQTYIDVVALKNAWLLASIMGRLR